VFNDKIESLVETKLAHSYRWEIEAFRDTGLLEGELIDEDEHSPVPASEEDDAQRAQVREKAEMLVEHLREMAEELGVAEGFQRGELLGWWQVRNRTVRPGAPRRLMLPLFKGDERLSKAIGDLADTIRAGGRPKGPVPQAVWLTPRMVEIFWRWAVRDRVPPKYVSIDDAQEVCATGELGRWCLLDECQEAREQTTERLAKIAVKLMLIEHGLAPLPKGGKVMGYPARSLEQVNRTLAGWTARVAKLPEPFENGVRERTRVGFTRAHAHVLAQLELVVDGMLPPPVNIGGHVIADRAQAAKLRATIVQADNRRRMSRWETKRGTEKARDFWESSGIASTDDSVTE
jgi:hypothetical protein